MSKVTLYNQKAEKTGEITLPASIFGVVLNNDLLHQAMLCAQGNQRKVLAHTKDRSEVRGGGKKPWRQKGTGRARHGSSRSPIWIGGGITFGPSKERNFAKGLNRKMKQKAVLMLLSQKLKDNSLFVLDKIVLAEEKTREFSTLQALLRKKLLREKKPANLLFVLDQGVRETVRVSRNLPKIKVIGANNLNVLDLLWAKNIICLEKSVEKINELYQKITKNKA